MKNMIIFLSGLFSGLAICAATVPELDLPFFDKDESVKVKRSLTGLCHPQGSQYFDYIIHYEPYDSLNQCVLEGGRLPLRVREDVVNFHSNPDTHIDFGNVQRTE